MSKAFKESRGSLWRAPSGPARDRTRRRPPFALRDIELVIPDGTTVAILGPSGCGKTTLLRLIAGLDTPDSGRILYDGHDMAGVPTGRRGIGMVFQNYALYPNFTTDQNILAKFHFQKRTPEIDEEARQKYQRTCDLMGVDITDLLGRFPDHLSGGEKQRVAIARCITRDPTVFLMDEPFSNLDMQMRIEFRLKLRQLLEHFGITTVYVTHDQVEARVLADVIAIMREGRILQIGTYQQLYEYPVTLFVADFLNINPATVAINVIDGSLIGPGMESKSVGIRPEDVALTVVGSPNGLTATVTSVLDDPLDDRTVVGVLLGDTELQVSTHAGTTLRRGDMVEVAIQKMHVFDRESGLRERTTSGPTSR